MKPDQVFGVLVILLAIWLGLTASGRVDAGGDLFDGLGDGDGFDFDFGGGDAGGDGGAGGDGADGGGDDGRAGAGGGTAAGGDAPLASIDEFCGNVPDTTTFEDVGPTHAADVRCMQEAGIVRGESATTYVPDDAVTREQLASTVAAMVREADALERPGADLRGLPTTASDDPRFPDVPPGNVHAEAIAALDEAGVFTGFVDATYQPDATVTRAQMASVLERAHRRLTGENLPIGGNAFTDDDRSVHHDAINATAAAGIVEGVGPDRYQPARAVLRGQMASMLARMMGHLAQTGRIQPLPG